MTGIGTGVGGDVWSLAQREGGRKSGWRLAGSGGESMRRGRWDAFRASSGGSRRDGRLRSEIRAANSGAGEAKQGDAGVRALGELIGFGEG